MEGTRYFRSANKFNVFMNFFSGNIFPLGDENINISLVGYSWVIIAWLIKFTYFSTGAMGSLYFGNRTITEMFKESGAMAVLCTEVIIPTVYLNLRRKELRKIIKKYNVILIDSDDLRRCIHDTVEPYKKGLKFYLIAALSATSAWSAAPIFKMFETNNFTYADFTVPAYLPGEPFGANIFIAGIILQVIGSCSIHIGKISVDLYVIYFIALLAAQYKYACQQLKEALNDEHGEKDDLSVIAALKKCILHQCAVIEIGQRLTKLMALHIGATYITCILKFCFLAYGVITFGNANIEKIAYSVYLFGCMVQVLLLCSSIQELLDSSTSITDHAFHENWYTRSGSMKRIFCMIELTNRMECRLSAWRVVDLVVPTFALIMSKSYSVCLLLLKVN